MPFSFRPLAIPDVVVVRPERHEDARGVFMESWSRSAFLAGGIDAHFVQDNLTRSGPGVLRGLHYQRPPRAQGKLVHVLRGRIFDVAVDLRPHSSTKGQWVSWELSDEGGELLWVPTGFAHGYAVLGDAAEVAYKVTAEYDPSCEAGIRWNDPTLAIPWPLAQPTLSERDRMLPLLVDAEAAG